tara:strand:+ start:139 stop:384 length:246 start_codon:yes stop_codon:yes gene_type:complete
MKIRQTFTISLETTNPESPLLKRELNRLEIATRQTPSITRNGYFIYLYTAPVEELVTLLELFWDMDETEAEDFVLSHHPNF